MSTLRDYEFGDRPTCNACSCELDPETDCHHDGYRGSPHAHNGRGSYGMGSHHFVFGELCESCSSRPAPLQKILEYNYQTEWLACGHTQATPRDKFGHIRSGERRRCKKCRLCYAVDFDVAAMLKKQAAAAFLRKLRNNWLRPVEVVRHDTSANWRKFAEMLAFKLGEDTEFTKWVPNFSYSKNPVAALKAWVETEVAAVKFNSDDH